MTGPARPVRHFLSFRDDQARVARWTPALATRAAGRLARYCAEARLAPAFAFPLALERLDGPGLDGVFIHALFDAGRRPDAATAQLHDGALAWWLERLMACLDAQEAGL